jgi:hypothetical protein
MPEGFGNAAGLRLAAQVTNQRTNHPISIDPVRLRPPSTPVHLQTGRIEDMVVDAVCLQHAMQPEPVISSLVAGHHFDRPAKFPNHAAADSLDQFKQRLASHAFTW